MADIRINALVSTATTTAADDYLAIDGSASGTRKLSAYSPTFGGNLTVSGKIIGGNSSDSGAISTLRSSGAATGLANVKASSALTVVDNTTANTDSAMVFGVNGSGAYIQGLYTTVASTITLQPYGGATTLGGNLTVSGGLLTLNNATESYVELKIAGTTKGYLDQLPSTLNVLGMSGVDVDIYAGGNNPANRVAKFAASGIATTLYGNLTVSGTGTSSFASNINVNKSTAVVDIGDGTTGPNFRLVSSVTGDANAYLQIGKSSADTNANLIISRYSTGSTAINSASIYANTTLLSGALTVNGGTETKLSSSGANVESLFVSNSGVGSNTAASLVFKLGNFSYGYIRSIAAVGGTAVNRLDLGANNGSPVLSVNSTGNALIGTTTDTGEKLQVNGTGYFAGALLQLGNGTVDAIYRVAASNGKSSDFGDDTTGGFVRANNSQSLRFITGGNTALTLDASQNATFAGTISQTQPAAGSTANLKLGELGIREWGFYATGGKMSIRPSSIGTWSFNGNTDVELLRTTASTSTTTGALVVSGGVGVAGAANIGGAIAIGNTVQTAVAVASTHKVTIVIGGVTYYLLATNV